MQWSVWVAPCKHCDFTMLLPCPPWQLTLVVVFTDLVYLSLVIIPIGAMYAVLLVTACGSSSEELYNMDQAFYT